MPFGHDSRFSPTPGGTHEPRFDPTSPTIAGIVNIPDLILASEFTICRPGTSSHSISSHSRGFSISSSTGIRHSIIGQGSI